MVSISGIFRLQKLKAEHTEGQRVGWLELFFDLVYVATVIALGDKLSNDISLEGVLSFAALFIPTWWTWTGTAFYITRFNLDDVGHRLLIFAQMFAVAILAINIHDGLGETSQGFAIGYSGARLCLILMYVRAGWHRPRARQLTTRYATGFSLAATIWFVSVFVPEPARFIFWVVAMVIDFGTPLLPSTRRLQAESPPDTHHLPERFGLFTIIVLGEAFIKVITHASEEEHLELINALYGGLAFITAASLWWIYFDNIKGSVVRRTQFAGQVWVYMHLPLVASITAFGVASKKIVLLETGHELHQADYLLAAGAVSLALVAIALLDLATTETTRELTDNQVAFIRLGSAVVIMIAGFAGTSLKAGGLLGIIALVGGVQVVTDIYHYARVPDSETPHAKTPDAGY